MTPVEKLLAKMTELGCDPIEALGLYHSAYLHTSTESKTRSKHAEAQARYQAKKDAKKKQSEGSVSSEMIRNDQNDHTIYSNSKVVLDKDRMVKVVKSSKLRCARARTICPDNFTPSDENYAFGLKHGLTPHEVDLQADAMINWSVSNGIDKASWNATLNVFITKIKTTSSSNNQISSKPLTPHQQIIQHNLRVINDLRNRSHQPHGQLAGSNAPELFPDHSALGTGVRGSP